MPPKLGWGIGRLVAEPYDRNRRERFKQNWFRRMFLVINAQLRKANAEPAHLPVELLNPSGRLNFTQPADPMLRSPRRFAVGGISRAPHVIASTSSARGCGHSELSSAKVFDSKATVAFQVSRGVRKRHVAGDAEGHILTPGAS